MTDHDRERQLRQLLDGARHQNGERFASGFADRVMQRLADERASVQDPAVALERAIVRQTRRLIPALAAASLALSAWNWWSVRDSADSTVAAVLGMQPVTVATTSTAGTLVNAEAFQ